MSSWKATTLGALAIVLFATGGARAQENAGTSVAPSLRECYNTSLHNDPVNRPPTTINVLIDLIRKVEAGTTQSSRVLAEALIHRFRQDGIVRSPDADESVSVPYSPSSFQSHKNMILLKQLIVNDATLFPNDTLNSVEKCAMHFMLSNTVELRKRGDESQVCGRLGRYTMRTGMRKRRQAPEHSREEIDTDVAGDTDGQNAVTDVVPPNKQPRTATEIIPASDQSECPIENGVVWTPWGAVKAGSVIAGIATALSKQVIKLNNGMQVDSRFAATLSGDLAEAALRRRRNVQIGLGGNWRSTVAPRQYYLSGRENFEMTDADIRGGLDGLILAQNLEKWHQANPTMKISQVLDMYYSSHGVNGNPEFRACNRKMNTIAKDELSEQSKAFAVLYDQHVQLLVTMEESEIKQYTQVAVDKLMTYTGLNDMSCDTNEVKPTRVAADILIVLDTAWTFQNINDALHNLLDKLDVTPYGDGSSYKVINAQDGAVIMDTSRYVADFTQMYNKTVHEKHPSGFDSVRSLAVAEEWMSELINNASTANSIGGRSQVVLFVLYRGAELRSEDFIRSRKSYINSYRPDVKVMVISNENPTRFTTLADNNMVFPLSDSTNPGTELKVVIDRFQSLHRGIWNPKCRADMSGGSGNANGEVYVEPGTITYYRVAPNYFYGEGTRTIRVRSRSGTVTACGSSSVERPSKTAGSSDCKDDMEHQFDLNNLCTENVDSCTPYYLSLEYVIKDSQPQARCTEKLCRFPHNLVVTINVENFQCHSGASQLSAMVAALLVTLLTVFLN